MRKLSFLVMVLTAAGAACGDSGDDKKSDASLDSSITIPDSSTADASLPYPQCDRSEVPDMLPAYMGDKPFSRSGLMACQQKCGQDTACFTEQNCPGFDKFSECADDELLRCSAGSKGKCRKQFETYYCCIEASGCDLNSPTSTECVRSKCKVDIDAFVGCVQKDSMCTNSFTTCFGPDPVDAGIKPVTDAGTDGGTLTDGGTDGGTQKSRAIALPPIQGVSSSLLMSFERN